VKFSYIPAAEKSKLEQWLAGRFDVAVAMLRARLRTGVA